MRSNIKLQLTKLTPLQLVGLTTNVVAKMTGNRNYPTPAVDLTVLATKADELATAIEVATNGSKESKAIRNEIVTEVRSLLRVLSAYVVSVANGDRVILISSGFELRRTPEPIGTIEAPIMKKAFTTGKPGQVLLKWTTRRGAGAYRVLMTDVDPSIRAEWKDVLISNKASCLIEGLESYKTYWFAVIPVGAAGDGLMSNPMEGRGA